MLEASVRQLHMQLANNAVLLRKKELDFYLTWIQFMLFCAAIVFVNGLNGIVFPIQSSFDSPDEPTVLFQIALTLYIISNALAASLEFAVITCGLVALLMAPGLALNGPEGSMVKAVNGLKNIITSMFRMFIAGLAFAQLSLLMYFWVAESIMEWPLALAINLLVMGFSIWLVRKALYVYNLFWYDLTVAESPAKAVRNLEAAASAPAASTPQYGSTSNSSSALLPSPSFATTARPQNTFVNNEADAAIGSAARTVKKKKGFFS